MELNSLIFHERHEVKHVISSKRLLGLEPEIAVGYAAMRGHSIQPSSSVARAIQPWHFQGFWCAGASLIMFPKLKKHEASLTPTKQTTCTVRLTKFCFFSQVGTCWYICCTCRMWHGHPTTVVLVCRASPLVLNSSNTKNSKFWSNYVFQSGIQYKHSPILILAHVCFFLLIPPSSKKTSCTIRDYPQIQYPWWWWWWWSLWWLNT